MIKIIMIDAGINLTSKQFPEEYIPEMIQHSKDAHLSGWITISNSFGDWGRNLTLCRTYNSNSFSLNMTCGIHPHNASTVRPNTFELLTSYVTKNKEIVAIGETGLDYNRMFSTKEMQIYSFQKHLEVAALTKKPLYLHCRDAEEDFLRILKEAKTQYPSLSGLVHCFTGKTEHMKEYLDLGFYIGVTGWICDERRGENLREAVKYLPLDRLVIETDSPFLIPYLYSKKWNTKRNQPDSLGHVSYALSTLMKIDKKEIEDISHKNTMKLFHL